MAFFQGRGRSADLDSRSERGIGARVTANYLVETADGELLNGIVTARDRREQRDHSSRANGETDTLLRSRIRDDAGLRDAR